MLHEMFVSLWIGNTKSDKELWDYVRLDYTDDGKEIVSDFIREFDVNSDEFDEDYIESVRYPQQSNLISELLIGCSYENEVISGFVSQFGDKLESMHNSVILLYNYQHIPNNSTISNDCCRFMYIGSVKIVCID